MFDHGVLASDCEHSLYMSHGELRHCKHSRSFAPNWALSAGASSNPRIVTLSCWVPEWSCKNFRVTQQLRTKGLMRCHQTRQFCSRRQSFLRMVAASSISGIGSAKVSKSIQESHLFSELEACSRASRTLPGLRNLVRSPVTFLLQKGTQSRRRS